MKRNIVMALMVVTMLTVAGCGKTEVKAPSEVIETEVIKPEEPDTEVVEPDTAETADSQAEELIMSVLESADTTSIATVVSSLVEAESMGVLNLQAMQVQEGYLNGFDSEVVGFNDGYCIMPMISTIPFVGYIFSTEDSDSLLKVLDENHNTAWNVCTVADTVFQGTIGDYTYYFMTPETIGE